MSTRTSPAPPLWGFKLLYQYADVTTASRDIVPQAGQFTTAHLTASDRVTTQAIAVSINKAF